MAVNQRHVAFARKAIEAAGKTVAPEASAAELATHGAALEKGTASNAVPPELTVEGRQAAADAAENASIARHRPARPAGPAQRTARPSRPSAPRSVVAPVRQAAEQLGGAATGGIVQGDSALGRIMGAVVLGLGTLILGSMFTRRDFAINLGAGPAPVKASPANLAKPYVPLYTPPAAYVPGVPGHPPGHPAGIGGPLP